MNERIELDALGVPAAEAIPDAAIPDVDVVARVLAGDSALFELVMRRYNRSLFRLARGIVRDDDEARDVVQAAYVRAYYHLDQFRGPDGFKAWLARTPSTKRSAAPAVRRRWPTQSSTCQRCLISPTSGPSMRLRAATYCASCKRRSIGCPTSFGRSSCCAGSSNSHRRDCRAARDQARHGEDPLPSRPPHA